MKILLTSLGTRGDMEPFLAIGEILKRRGHEVICLFPEQFRDLAEDSGVRFESLGTRFLDMLWSKDGKVAMGGGGSGILKIISYIRLARKYKGINKELIIKQLDTVESEKPDRIVHNSKIIYPVIWGLKHPEKAIQVSPVPYLHYVKNHTHLAFNSNFGTTLNKFTFALAKFGLVKTIASATNWINTQEKIKKEQISHALSTSQTIYTISPTLYPRPSYWDDNLKVLGYHERDKTVNWKPDKELLDFIDQHKKILFVTFGSMTNPHPEKKTRIILDILTKNKIPALINTYAGGLVQPDHFNSNHIYFVSQIPYDWVFAKMYAVVHHGGSGTTHMALKHGCATMIIPHIIDQFVWNKIVADKGAGPKGIRIDKISDQNLEPKILDLWNNPIYKKKAEEIAGQMEKENFEEELYQSIIG